MFHASTERVSTRGGSYYGVKLKADGAVDGGTGNDAGFRDMLFDTLDELGIESGDPPLNRAKYDSNLSVTVASPRISFESSLSVSLNA